MRKIFTTENAMGVGFAFALAVGGYYSYQNKVKDWEDSKPLCDLINSVEEDIPNKVHEYARARGLRGTFSIQLNYMTHDEELPRRNNKPIKLEC